MIRGFPSLFRLMVDINEVLGIYSFSICLNDTTLPFILDMRSLSLSLSVSHSDSC